MDKVGGREVVSTKQVKLGGKVKYFICHK